MGSSPLVVDEPTDLPDGAEVEVVVEVVVIDDELTASERERSCTPRSTARWMTPRRAAVWTPGSISSSIEPAVELVLLAEAQWRFELS